MLFKHKERLGDSPPPPREGHPLIDIFTDITGVSVFQREWRLMCDCVMIKGAMSFKQSDLLSTYIAAVIPPYMDRGN